MSDAIKIEQFGAGGHFFFYYLATIRLAVIQRNYPGSRAGERRVYSVRRSVYTLEV